MISRITAVQHLARSRGDWDPGGGFSVGMGSQAQPFGFGDAGPLASGGQTPWGNLIGTALGMIPYFLGNPGQTFTGGPPAIQGPGSMIPYPGVAQSPIGPVPTFPNMPWFTQPNMPTYRVTSYGKRKGLRKCGQVLKSGKKGKCHRSMNACNPHALKRAIRRMGSFRHLAAQIEKHIPHKTTRRRTGACKPCRS